MSLTGWLSPRRCTYPSKEVRRSSEEEEELEDAIAELLSGLLVLGIVSLRPHVERYSPHETARPSLDARLTRVRARISRRRSRKAAVVVEGTVVEPSEALAEKRPRMSRAEAQARYLAGLAAQAFSDEQFRLVAQADCGRRGTWKSSRQSLGELPSGQVKELMQAMVKDPSLLDEANLAKLASLLGRRELLAQPRRAPG